MKPYFIITGALILGLASCANDADAAKKKNVSIGRFGVRYYTVPGAPEAVAVQETPVVEEKKPSAPRFAAFSRQSPQVSRPAPHVEQKATNAGIRMPNMLGMPEDRDLRATNPAGSGGEANQSGGVISRPPIEKKE